MTKHINAYSPVAGSISFNMKDEEGKIVDGQTLTDILGEFSKDKFKDMTLYNFGGHVRALTNIEHDPSVKNMVFIGKQAYRYFDTDPVDNPNRFFEVSRDGKTLDESSPQRTMVINFVKSRETLESIEFDSAKELTSYIESRGTFDEQVDELLNEAHYTFNKDKYNLNEMLIQAKAIVDVASKSYENEYGSPNETIFSEQTKNQAALMVLQSIEEHLEFEPRLKVEQKAEVKSKNTQKP